MFEIPRFICTHPCTGHFSEPVHFETLGSYSVYVFVLSGPTRTQNSILNGADKRELVELYLETHPHCSPRMTFSIQDRSSCITAHACAKEVGAVELITSLALRDENSIPQGLFLEWYQEVFAHLEYCGIPLFMRNDSELPLYEIQALTVRFPDLRIVLENVHTKESLMFVLGENGQVFGLVDCDLFLKAAFEKGSLTVEERSFLKCIAQSNKPWFGLGSVENDVRGIAPEAILDYFLHVIDAPVQNLIGFTSANLRKYLRLPFSNHSMTFEKLNRPGYQKWLCTRQ
jgi:hypothetical protein